MRKIVATADGSLSILIENTRQQYHSSHGAILEAEYVYIIAGLNYLLSNYSKPINIFEMGFGTGLNCFLTYLASFKINQRITYTSLEAFPVEISEIKQLNFADKLNQDNTNFQQFHKLKWGANHMLTPNFYFQKIHSLFQTYSPLNKFDLIYYDAFGARTQPELWTIEITDKLSQMLVVKGILVTYSVFGNFRRNLLDSGFFVEKIAGPPGKREMLRAIKLPC